MRLEDIAKACLKCFFRTWCADDVLHQAKWSSATVESHKNLILKILKYTYMFNFIEIQITFEMIYLKMLPTLCGPISPGATRYDMECRQVLMWHSMQSVCHLWLTITNLGRALRETLIVAVVKKCNFCSHVYILTGKSTHNYAFLGPLT